MEITNGNLLDASESIIVHQVNCQRTIRSGIALQIVERYPHVYEDYLQFFDKHDDDVLGRVCYVKVEDDKFIANLYGQEFYGYERVILYTSYEAVRSGLKDVAAIAKRYNLSVALPYKLGSDRGGAQWSKIKAIIAEELKDVQYKIYRYKGDN